MEKTKKTEKTETQGKSLFSFYLDIESAVAPIDDAIRSLKWAYVDFDLGDFALDEYQRFNLLNNYQNLGSMIFCAVHTLEKVRDDFEKLIPRNEKSSDEETSESAN